VDSGLVIVVLATGIAALVQIFTDPRITREFIYKSLVVLAVYAAHLAVGLLVLIYLLPHHPDSAIGSVAALLGWLGLGFLGLVRFAPRLREPPAFLMQFGIADAVFLLMIAGGLASAMQLF
jgi:hypothetical protein